MVARNMIRFPGWGAIAVGCALAMAGASPLAAQSTTATDNSSIVAPPPPAAANVVGPRELQNFSLGGRTARPAEPVPAPAETTAPPPISQPVTSAARPSQAPPKPAPAAPSKSTLAEPQPKAAEPNASTVSAQPSFAEPTPAAPVVLPPSSAVSVPDIQPQPDSAPRWPWWVAGLAAVAALAWFGWRRRPVEQLAVRQPLQRATPPPAPPSDTINARIAATPPPSDTINARLPAATAPRQPRSVHPALDGAIVSRGLRPQLAFEFKPIRVEIDATGGALLSFELTVINNGGAPARDLTIEAAMMNAGPSQDTEIAAFFRSPVARGDRIPLVPPMGRINVRSRVPLAPHQINPIEIEGRKLLVPLVAINALYRWSGGDGHQSASFLVGRGGEDGGKMGPFSLDRGPRAWAGLGARPHSAGLPA